MNIAIIFIVVFFTLLLIQIGVTDYIRFYREFDLGSWQLRMPSEPQVTHLEELWEAKKARKNNQKNY